MQSTEYVNTVARVIRAAHLRREASWDAAKHKYRLSHHDAVEAAIDEICPNLDGPELSLMQMCANGGFQGEFVDWANGIGKGY